MQSPRGKILGIALLVEGAVFILALGMAGYFKIPLSPLTDNFFRDILVGTVGASLPFLLFLFTLSAKAKQVPLFSSLRKTMLTEVRALFSYTHLPDLLFISFLAGVAEEMLFRGVLQAKYGIVAASVAFGLAHCLSPAYVIVTTIMGLYMGALFLFCGNLFVPMYVHFIYDLSALVYLRYILPADCE